MWNTEDKTIKHRRAQWESELAIGAAGGNRTLHIESFCNWWSTKRVSLLASVEDIFTISLSPGGYSNPCNFSLIEIIEMYFIE